MRHRVGEPVALSALARLAASPYAADFVLKGGMLLATLDARRPTADADLMATHLVG